MNSVASIDKSLDDLKAFCSNKNSINFCSPDHMGMAVALLQRQREIIRKKIEAEERKSQRMRQKNRINSEKMIWALREHFLDRHF
jgi:hypothetical protein